MGNFLTHGYTYIDGTTNVNATNLHALVDDAVLKPEAISALSAKNPVAGTEELLINDGGVLKKATAQVLANFVFSLAIVPTGVIMDFAGTTAPIGWFFCYGQSLSRSTYSVLFLAIGTTYGSVDGSSFSLPDLRGRVTAGKDDMGGTDANRLTDTGSGIVGTTLGATGGDDHLQNHTHTMSTYPVSSEGGSSQGLLVSVNWPGRVMIDASPEVGWTTGSPDADSGGTGNSGNAQPTIVMNKIIKY